MTDVQSAYLKLLSAIDFSNSQHLTILQDFRSIFRNELEPTVAPSITVTGQQPIIQSAPTSPAPHKGYATQQLVPRVRRGGRKTQYTYNVVISAVRQTKTLKEAGILLNLKDPNYIYELARRYEIPTSRNAQLKLPIK